MVRFLGLLALAALAAALLFGACLAACGVAVVSVVSNDGPTIVAPVPLLIPLAALEFLPEHLFDEAHADLDRDAGPALLALGALLTSLEDVDEAVLVRVEDGDDLVLVAKEQEDIVVRIREEGSDARVLVRAPIRALARAAEACAETAPDDDERDHASATVRCDGRALASAVIRFARGAEVEVRDRDARVDISVW